MQELLILKQLNKKFIRFFKGASKVFLANPIQSYLYGLTKNSDPIRKRSWQSYYNPDHNMLAICCVSVEVLFSSSKPGLDFLYNEFCIINTSRVNKLLKTKNLTKLGNDRKILQIGGDTDLCSVFLAEIDVWH